jgi:hypothetical protein
MPMMTPMNAPHPSSSGKQQVGATATTPPLHVRQRELVRASLFARPEAKRSATHRRWA